jgi:CRISPR-associated protein Csb1
MSERQLFTVPLRPAIGERFQPTGFPNLGAAVFDRPTSDGGWERCLLVESEQSMANRLEATMWDAPEHRPIDLIAGLASIRIVDGDGEFLTSSRLEAHRIASAYVREGTVDGQKAVDVINDRLGLDSDRQRAPHEIAEGLFSLDPMVLIHGVFMSHKSFPGQPKVARAITAFVEAHDVREAYGGGVKKDSVFTGQDEGRGSSEGYGMVPFDRTEWTAREIVLSVDLDLQQIASYGLPEPAERLLVALARLELRYLLDGGLRFRTACDLVVDTDVIRDHEDRNLESADELEKTVTETIGEVADLLSESLTITWSKKKG